jgi:alanine-glyoxylate transaminase/serine-glyoxylate transaminase/serine-pyruvate transaminase
MATIPPPAVLFEPMQIPKKTLLGPGPSNPHPAIIEAMTQPVLGYLHPEFLEIMDQVRAGLQYVFQTRNKMTLCVSGTGHSGMEAALVNLLEPGETVVIVEHGLWGQRASEMGTRMGCNVVPLPLAPGQGFETFEKIEETLKQHKPAVLFICYGDSTTGVMQPLQGLSDLCHRYNCLLLVDTVAALGGTPFFTDEWGIDCVYSGSQKVLGCPPGLAPITFSDAAQKKIANRKTKPLSFYLDMMLVGNYWGCFDEVRKYHHTGPINLVYGLRAAVAEVAKEGLENVVARHQRNALRLHKGLEELGLELFVKNPKLRLPTLTTVEVPENVDWKAVVDHLMNKHRIEIAGGLGATAGKIWRIGLMGYNSTEENVDKVLAALSEALSLTEQARQSAKI